ncbi:MAG TPA: formate/nitrite transporter family protein [Tepidisphaeraceae bacterium]|jgi:formate/nitrite transporter FocA (FNT family)|nr:formate/nitrite transporter family protein [Tepidisphaeraceae bacterium]
MTTDTAPAEPKDAHEKEEAKERSSPSGKIVYLAIEREAKEELSRPSVGLFWSGLAAGLSMAFSVIGEAVLREHLPEAAWTSLVAELGYSIGFLIVILGRQQLFTENTLTPVLPLLRNRDRATFMNVARLWATVLIANLLGAMIIALVLVKTNALAQPVVERLLQIGHSSISHGFGTVLLRGIFAGWLIALLVWMMPAAEAARFFLIIVIAWMVGIGEFSHVIAGAVDIFALAWAGEKSWAIAFGGFVLPALIGNIIGGVALVAGLNYAQVSPGSDLRSTR